MKEEEAKTKHCIIGAQRVKVDGLYTHNCIGSECMGWESDYETERKEIPVTENVPDGWTLINKDNSVKRIYRFIRLDTGDCGLKTKYLECNN